MGSVCKHGQDKAGRKHSWQKPLYHTISGRPTRSPSAADRRTRKQSAQALHALHILIGKASSRAAACRPGVGRCSRATADGYNARQRRNRQTGPGLCCMEWHRVDAEHHQEKALAQRGYGMGCNRRQAGASKRKAPGASPLARSDSLNAAPVPLVWQYAHLCSLAH